MNELPRNIRNNNPGNIINMPIKYDGEVTPSQDPKFKQFKSLAYGFRALFKNLHKKYTVDGKKTIRSMMLQYAPSSDGNNTFLYIKTVSDKLKIGPDDILPNNPNVFKSLARIIYMTEGGNEYPKDVTDDINEGFKLCDFKDINYDVD